MKPMMMDSFHCSRIVGTLVLAVLTSIPTLGQDCMLGVRPSEGEVIGTVSLGLGSTSSKEEFLSPRPYSGPSLSAVVDRQVNRGDDRLFQYSRSHYSLLFSPMTNDLNAGSQLQAMIDVFYGWGHVVTEYSAYELMIGPAAMGTIGALYNRRNSNNPATAEGYLAMGFMADNILRFHIGRYPMAFQATLFLPVAGMGFAPDYDQLYWIMYQDRQYARTLHFMYPGNAPTLYQDMALSIPLKNNQFRLAFSYDYTKNEWGKQHTKLSHATFMVGVTHRFERKYNGR